MKKKGLRGQSLTASCMWALGSLQLISILSAISHGLYHCPEGGGESSACGQYVTASM